MTRPPVTVGQERMWLQDRLAPGGCAYNMFLVRRFRGALDLEVLQAALTDVATRQAALRTTFAETDGVVWQRVAPPEPVPLDVVDLRGVPAGERERQAHAQVGERTNDPFDLATGLLLRAGALRLGDEDHVIVIVTHHIVADGWSLGIFAKELADAYAARREGRVSTPPPLRIDYAEWAARCRAADLSAGKDYWGKQLSGAADLRLANGIQDTSGAYHAHRLPQDLTTRLEQFARSHRCSLFMTLMAGYQILLSRYTGQEDVCVGTFTAGRDTVETEPLIGYFINTLVLRGDLAGNPTVTDLLGRTRATALEAYAHRDVPFELLMTDLGIARNPDHNPLFQTTFVLQNPDAMPLSLPGLRGEPFDDAFVHCKVPLAVEAWRERDGLTLFFGHQRAAFSRDAIAAMGRHFETLLNDMVTRPGARLHDLTMLTKDERTRLLGQWATGPTTAGSNDGGVVGLIRTRVDLRPQTIALWHGEERITYGELGSRVTSLAVRLRLAGAGPGSTVAICADPSADLVIAMLAVWEAGAAYLPMDPEYPQPRLAFLLKDSRAELVLCQEHLVDRLPPGTHEVILLDTAAAGPCHESAPPPHPDDAAYLIYTSGSTGVPKGVRVSHGALASRVDWMRQNYALTPQDRVLQFASASFDTHAEEIYPCLAAGSTLVLRTSPGALLPEILATPAGQEVTVLDLPTPYWHELVAAPQTVAWPPGLRLVILGADQVHGSAVAAWFDMFGKRIRLINTYGPTESTIIATAAELSPASGEGIPPIGRPIAGTRAYVLDGHLRPQPVGVAGQLWLGGAGLAQHYHDRPALTAAHFVPDPFGPPGSRLYDTGDRARFNADATLTFLGRDDHQVKVRGYRVELGEIEEHLRRHPLVRNAIAIAREQALVAHVATGLTGNELSTHLALTLPPHMIPTTFVIHESLPLTPNGKVDREKLSALDCRPSMDQLFVAPRTTAEELVCAVWREVLSLDRVGALDDFFIVGGHSLLATRVGARLSAAIGVEVPIRALFTHRTVADLATAVEELVLADMASADIESLP